jgi:hypothetical protein
VPEVVDAGVEVEAGQLGLVVLGIRLDDHSLARGGCLTDTSTIAASMLNTRRAKVDVPRLSATSSPQRVPVR